MQERGLKREEAEADSKVFCLFAEVAEAITANRVYCEN
jgi:hypothetical protein